ncbi:MAG: NADPH:quinone oxidoreductase family protein [Burkholderiaceae bacterium]|nr:NADPH:quinone oxidoreductase family protein [Burkholderiaceae bacterium]
MRAILVEKFGEPEALALREVPAPVPGPGDVLIEVHAAGVNYPDYLVAGGKYQKLAPLPFIIGKEGAGLVLAVGPGVSRVKPGQRVAFEVEAGAFAEQVCVRQGMCFPVPDGVPMVAAAALGLAYQTAWYGLHECGRIKAGDWVLVTGAAGGVGVAAVQLARAAGANVIAGLGTMSKADFVRAHGAQAVVDLAQPQLNEVLRDQIHAITAGRGLDIVVDMVGGDAFSASLRAMAEGGRMLVVGFTSGVIPQVKANYLLLKHLSVIGVNWSGWRDAPDTFEATQAQAKIFALAASGRMASPVSATFALEDAPRAVAALRDRSFVGKMVLIVKPGA